MNRYRISGIGCRVGVLIAALFTILPLRALAQPAKGYDAISYAAQITLDRQTDSIFGVVTMQARVLDDTVSIGRVLQYAKFLTIDSVFVNGSRATFAFDDTSSGAYHVVANLGQGAAFTVQTFYHGKGMPEQNSYKWGGVSDEDSIMFALGVGFATTYTGCTRHWLPCYDLPDDKADSVDLTFITDPADITASNGLLVSNELTSGGIHKGERIMHWHVNHPIATYLLTFATGPLAEQDIPNSLGIPFQVYALQSDSAKATAEMRARVAPILAFYDSLFAPYPFEKVGYVITPIGSMESQTMIDLDSAVLDADSLSDANDTTLNGTTAIHELSHMWWGDRVTCKTFDDAWLNEGFAHFCESLVLERLFGREHYVSRQHMNAIDARGTTLPLFGAATADSHSDNYPYSTIYEKGAAVLGMLRQYLGDSIFFSAIRYYGNTHAYSTATSYDLWNDFDTISGQDLAWFFKPWVFGTGYPKDTIVWSQTSNGASIAFHQMKNNPGTAYFRVPVPVKGTTTGGLSKTVTVWMDSTQFSTDSVDFGFMPDALSFDPDGLLVMRIIRVTQVAAGVGATGATTGSLELRVFPNPDNSMQLEVSINVPQALGIITGTLSDMRGHKVRTFQGRMTTSPFNFNIALQDLPNGSYFLTVRAGSEEATQKISIEN